MCRAAINGNSSHFCACVKAAVCSVLCSAIVVRAQCLSMSKGGVNRYRYITSWFISLPARAWARHVLALPWCLSFPVHSCLSRNEQFLLMERNVGSQRDWRPPPLHNTSRGKALHQPDPSPSQAHTPQSLLIYQRSDGKRVWASPGTSPSQDLSWASATTKSWPQQSDWQRPLSIRRCTLLRPPAIMETGEKKKKKAVFKNKQLTSYCSTSLLRWPLCQVLSMQNNLFERNSCQLWLAGVPKRKYYPELQFKGFLLNFV